MRPCIFLGAAAESIRTLGTIVKVFNVLFEALTRHSHKGKGIVQLNTAPWPCLMPRVVHVLRKLARCLPLMEVGCSHPA